METELYGKEKICWGQINKNTLAKWLNYFNEEPENINDQFDKETLTKEFKERYPSIHFYYGEKLLKIINQGEYCPKDNFTPMKEREVYKDNLPIKINYENLKKEHRDLYDFYFNTLKIYIYECSKDDNEIKCKNSIGKVNNYILENFYKKK